MDEYLSEKEQIERIREWWRENRLYLIGGVVLAAVGYFGFGQYRAYDVQQKAEASALYAQMRQLLDEDRPGADALLDQLSREHAGSPYTDQARLLLAREYVVGDPERAASELRTVMETSPDPELAMVARVRLARVLAYEQSWDEALDVLAVDSPGEFAAQIKELEGDIRADRGDVEGARIAYTAALTSQGADGLDLNLLQIKLADLVPPPAEAPAGEAPSAEAAAPAADASPAGNASPAEASGADASIGEAPGDTAPDASSDPPPAEPTDTAVEAPE